MGSGTGSSTSSSVGMAEFGCFLGMKNPPFRGGIQVGFVVLSKFLSFLFFGRLHISPDGHFDAVGHHEDVEHV